MIAHSRTVEGRDGLAAIVAQPGRAVVALDFDGTLAPIVADPSTSRADPAAITAVARLAAHVGSVLIVTGRPAKVAVELGGLEGLAPNVVVLGHYGWERWEACSGTVSSPAPLQGLDTARAELPPLLAGTGAHVEDKCLSLAVHTRQAPDPDSALQRLRQPLSDLADRCGLAVEPGRCVLELRMPGMDKGAALGAFVREREAAALLFAGDDLGDLPAFETVADLRGQGVPGVTVCSASTEVTGLRERTDVSVDGPRGMARLLDELADAVRGHGQ